MLKRHEGKTGAKSFQRHDRKTLDDVTSEQRAHHFDVARLLIPRQKYQFTQPVSEVDVEHEYTVETKPKPVTFQEGEFVAQTGKGKCIFRVKSGERDVLVPVVLDGVNVDIDTRSLLKNFIAPVPLASAS